MSALFRAATARAVPRAAMAARSAVRRTPARAMSSSAAEAGSSNTPFYAVAGALGLVAVALGLQANKPNKAAAPAAAAAKQAPVAVEAVVKPVEPVAPPPPPPPPAPLDAPYVIVGGGTAAYFAMRGILARDKMAKIIIVTSEDELPYARTPLSKELWFNAETDQDKELKFRDWADKTRSVYFEEPSFYATSPEELLAGDKGGVAVITNRTVVDMNVYRKKLQLNDQRVINFDKCLLATGGEPKNLPIFEAAGDEVNKHVTLFRRTKDYRELRALTDKGKNVVVIGGGFLGSELSVALASQVKKNGGSVTQLFPESGNLAKILPEYLSKWTTSKVVSEGVSVVPSTSVTGVRLAKNKKSLTLQLSNGTELDADHVVVAVGCAPNTQLASLAHLEVDHTLGGVVVNAELEARSDVWVAGDVANFYDPTLGRRREEHHDHAAVSGRLAGENMTGARKPYFHQSMFWSDLGPQVGFEAIGLIDPKLETVGIWAKATPKPRVPVAVEEVSSAVAPVAAADDGTCPLPDTTAAAAAAAVVEPTAVETASEAVAGVETEFDDGYGKGVVFYMRDRAVVGLVMWNVHNKIPIARKIIRSQKKFDNVNDLAKLLRIHE